MLAVPSNLGEGSRELLILDTGPLWELLLFDAVHRLRFHSLRKHIEYLSDGERFSGFSRFVSVFRHKSTTPSVVAELSAKIVRTDPSGRLKMWIQLRDEFVNMGMDEEIVKFLEMPIDLVGRYGVVDQSVLELARRHARFRPQIVTVDGKLAAECRRAGLQAFHLSEILY